MSRKVAGAVIGSLLASAMALDRRNLYASGRISQQFDLGQIMHVRRNNQRNKNQRRIKAMRGRH